MKQVDSALRRAAVLKQREADTAINQMMFGMNQANMIDSFGQPILLNHKTNVIPIQLDGI